MKYRTASRTRGDTCSNLALRPTIQAANMQIVEVVLRQPTRFATFDRSSVGRNGVFPKLRNASTKSERRKLMISVYFASARHNIIPRIGSSCCSSAVSLEEPANSVDWAPKRSCSAMGMTALGGTRPTCLRCAYISTKPVINYD